MNASVGVMDCYFNGFILNLNKKLDEIFILISFSFTWLTFLTFNLASFIMIKSDLGRRIKMFFLTKSCAKIFSKFCNQEYLEIEM